MAATTDQILQQEQLHYQVLNQKIDNLYTNLNSSINTQDQRVITYLTSEAVNTRAKVDADANVINSRINAAITQLSGNDTIIVNKINQRFDALRADTLGKLDVISNNLLADIDKRAAVTDGDIDYAMNRVLSQVDGDTKLVEFKVDGNLTATLDKLNTVYQLVIDRTGSVNTTLNNSVQTKISESEALLSTKTDAILKAINDAANAAQNPIVNVQTPVTPPAQNGTDFLSQLIALLSGAAPVGAQDNSDGTTPYGGRPILLSTGDSYLNQNTLFTSLSDASNELTTQIKAVSVLIDNATTGKYTTLDQFETDFRKIGVDTGLIGGVVQLLFIIPSLLNIGKQLTDVFNLRIQRLTAEKYDLAQLDVSSIVELFRRKYIDKPSALSGIEALGYSDKDANNLLALGNQLLDTNTLIQAQHRGLLDSDIITKHAEQLGFQDSDWNTLLKVSQIRPGINDLINFAVKEVYSPETTAKFGQYQEFPQEFSVQAKANGLDSVFAQQYWAAHWQLPGAQTGYEMLHRGIINEVDLKALLKALDVMPFWRDKLIQLSYKVLPRVDARRLHAFNIINDSELHTIYKQEGYSETDAARLVKLATTIEDEQENPKKKKLRDLTYSVIISAYGDGLLTKQDVINQLLPLGYDNDEINLLLRIEDYNLAKANSKKTNDKHYAKLTDIATKSYINRAISRDDLLVYLHQAGFSNTDAQSEANFIDAEYAISFKAQIAKDVEQQYFEGLYADNDVIISLQALGFLPSEANNILTQLQTLKTFRTKKPSLSQFTSLYKKGFYTEEQYIQILKDDGYADEFIPALLFLAKPDDTGV